MIDTYNTQVLIGNKIVKIKIILECIKSRDKNNYYAYIYDSHGNYYSGVIMDYNYEIYKSLGENNNWNIIFDYFDGEKYISLNGGMTDNVYINGFIMKIIEN